MEAIYDGVAIGLIIGVVGCILINIFMEIF